MKILIFSGAGLDAESGIDTFRDSGGMWEQNDVMKVCTMNTFDENYELIHEFYNQRRVELAGVFPNSAHIKISELCKKYNVVNITANVTDLLERSGVEDVIHIHGELTKVNINYGSSNQECIDIGYNEHNLVDGRCDKPAVIFFGEGAPEYSTMQYELNSLTPDDICIVVGSTLSVNPIHYEIYESGCKFILINPEGVDGSVKSCLNDAINLCDIFINQTATGGFHEIDQYIEEHIKERNYRSL
jgi:NAD-dependent deacetylase